MSDFITVTFLVLLLKLSHCLEIELPLSYWVMVDTPDFIQVFPVHAFHKFKKPNNLMFLI